jgi:hypothetical protein
MLRTIIRSLVCLGVFVATFGVVPAYADPMRITSGVFTANQTSSEFTFLGDGLRLSAAGNGLTSSLFSCTPCETSPPMELSFSGDLAGADLRGGEPGQFNGVSYDHTFLAGSLYFSGQSFSTSMLSADNLTLSSPFSMTASIQNYASGATSTSEPPLFTASLFGRGIATARFGMVAVPGQAPLFTINSVSYQFQSEPAAVTPEPASLLLLGTGLAGVVMRRRRPRTQATDAHR